MKTSKFHKLLSELDRLNNLQFRLIKERINNIEDINFVASELETSQQDVNCPHCKSTRIKKWGKRSDLQRYRCNDCSKTFNSLTGTPLARLRKKGRWLNYTQCLKLGHSVRKSAELCGVHRNTTFKWRHRFLQTSVNIKPENLNGIIEIIEKFIPYSEKGSKNSSSINRNKKICILFGKDRNSNTLDTTVASLNSNTLNKSLKSCVAHDSLICSNNLPILKKFYTNNNLKHGLLHVNRGELLKKDIIHLNNCIEYKNHLFHWFSRFRGVATKYLNNYLSWYRELDEFDFRITPSTLLKRAKSRGIYSKQPQSVT